MLEHSYDIANSKGEDEDEEEIGDAIDDSVDYAPVH